MNLVNVAFQNALIILQKNEKKIINIDAWDRNYSI